jgi:hypothetical protein
VHKLRPHAVSRQHGHRKGTLHSHVLDLWVEPVKLGQGQGQGSRWEWGRKKPKKLRGETGAWVRPEPDSRVPDSAKRPAPWPRYSDFSMPRGTGRPPPPATETHKAMRSDLGPLDPKHCRDLALFRRTNPPLHHPPPCSECPLASLGSASGHHSAPPCSEREVAREVTPEAGAAWDPDFRPGPVGYSVPPTCGLRT